MSVPLNNQSDVVFKLYTQASLPTPTKSRLASFIAMCSFCLQVLSEIPICNLIMRGVAKLFCLSERVKKINIDAPLNNKTIAVINPPPVPPLNSEHLIIDPSALTSAPPLPCMVPNEPSMSEEPTMLSEVTHDSSRSSVANENLSLSPIPEASPVAVTTEDSLVPLVHSEAEALASNATSVIMPKNSSSLTSSGMLTSVEKVFEERIGPTQILTSPTAEVKIADYHESDLQTVAFMEEVVAPAVFDVALEVTEGTHTSTTQASEVLAKSTLGTSSGANSLQQSTMDVERGTQILKNSIKPTRISKKRLKLKKMPAPPKPKKASWSLAKVIKLIFFGALGAYIGSYAENLVPKSAPPALADIPSSEIKFATTTVLDNLVPPLDSLIVSESVDSEVPTINQKIKLPIEPFIKKDVPIGPIEVTPTPPIVREDDPLSLKQKICLFTSYTQDNADRLLMSRTVAANQKAYAQANEYQYIVREENLAVDIDRGTGKQIKLLPYWSKIAFVNNILNAQETFLTEKPEWLVWMDDDVVVTNAQVRLEEVIAHYTKDANVNFFVAQDSMSHILKDIPLNSAILFIRNNEWSREFFSSVWKMRNVQVNSLHTYGNCPNQSCLHEQQAITDLIKLRPELKRHVRIIPQRDSANNWGINTFHRWSHWDAARNMYLDYAGDLPASKWKPGDFLGQCTGLTVEHRWTCVKQLLNQKR